jgi:hypothetical protein
MPAPTHGSVIGLIDGFLKEANADLEKEASNLDLAGDAKSTHPSANVDDKTKPATEGARSSENEADVRKEVPDTINDPASENKGGEEEGATVNGDQGTVTMSADSGLKGTVDTPKKDHSKSMSDSGPGDDSFKGDWDKASAAGSLVGDANQLLADVAMLTGTQTPTQTQAQPAAKADGDAQKSAADAGQSATDDKAAELFKAAAEQYPEDVEAGYVAAALLAQQMGLMKEAGAEGEVTEEQMVANIQKSAALDGQNYVEFLQGFAEEMEKSAQPMGADPAALAALAGEGDAGGEMGAEELAAGAGEEGAGEELAGLGGEEELAGAGEAGEGDVLEELAAVLEQAGIEPEELAEALAAQDAGGEGGEEGAVAPEVAPEAGMAAPEVG